MCPKYYIQFGQALSTHLVNKHSYTDVALKEFFGNCYYAGKEESSKNFHCEFGQRNFKGKKWLINHISTTHCNYIQSPHLHRLLVEPSLNEIVSKKARRKLTKCNHCNKRFSDAAKHKCKIPPAANDSIGQQVFNFSDNYFLDESIIKANFSTESDDFNDTYEIKDSPYLTELKSLVQESKFHVLHLNINSVFCKFFNCSIKLWHVIIFLKKIVLYTGLFDCLM